MRPSTEAIFLGPLARKFNVRFSLTPSNVTVAGRRVTEGFDLYLVGTHVNPMFANTGTCKQCQQVLMALLELADWAVPIRPGKGPSRPDNNFEKLTQFAAGLGCAGGVSLLVRLAQRRAFEQTMDGWALDFLLNTTKFLLDLGCRQTRSSNRREKAGRRRLARVRGRSRQPTAESGCVTKDELMDKPENLSESRERRNLAGFNRQDKENSNVNKRQIRARNDD